MSYRMSRSRTYPVAFDQAYGRVLPIPLPDLFRRRFGPIPPVRSVHGQTGGWGDGGVGQTRTIVLTDGGSMRETLAELDPPQRFAYRIDEVTGPLAPLVAEVLGAWTFVPAGTGVRITWSWEVAPAGRLGALAERPFRWLWHGYARQALDDLEPLLLA